MIDCRYLLIISPECSYCEKAVALMIENRKNFTVQVYDFEDDELVVLKEEWNHPTVPIVSRGQELIGGYTELMEHFNGTKANQTDEE